MPQESLAVSVHFPRQIITSTVLFLAAIFLWPGLPG